MKEMDCVEVIAEKKAYTDEGVYKGMCGWICDPRCINGYYLVNFPCYGEHPDIATIGIHKEDMRVVPVLDVKTNEHIKAQHEK